MRIARGRLLAIATLALAPAACGGTHPTRGARPWPGSAATHPGRGPDHLSVATETAVLPLNVLVAQADGRLVSISPHGQVVWRKRQSDPGAVFVSRTGRTAIIAEPHESVVVLRRIDSGAVAWVYGARGQPGSGENRLRDPRTALEARDGEVVIADAGNCRVLLVWPDSHRPRTVLGGPSRCVHDIRGAALGFEHPDAAFPAPGGQIVVTERRPGWVDFLSRAGRPLGAIRLRGLVAPSDANVYGATGLIVTDATRPGRVVELDRRTGAVKWSYGPSSGAGELDSPTLACVLPDGDVLVADTGNDRVIVIDRSTGTIVWQYGHTGVAGAGPGFLDAPRSVTLVPLGGI